MQISMDIHSPNKYVLSASHAPGPGDRKHAGWGGSWDAENVSRVGLKDQNVSDQPGPSPRVGDMRLLLPVPSTVTSPAVQPCPAVGSGVWSLCRRHKAPRGPGACLHPPGLSVLLAIWSPASGPASPSFCFGCASDQDKARTPAAALKSPGDLSLSSQPQHPPLTLLSG